MAYTWIPFYKELSQKLLQFKNDRKPLVDFIYSELSKVGSKSLVDYIHMEDGSRVTDIDPFSMFAIFNRSLKRENKIGFLQKFKGKFDLKTEIPTDFDGIPTVNSQRAFFFNWADKNAESIRQFWDLFETVVLEKDISTIFDQMVNNTISQYSLTMILFWIAPERFLNLDGRNRAYLNVLGFPEKYPNLDYSNYSKLMQDVHNKMDDHSIPCSSFPELSHAAFLNSPRRQEKEKKDDSNTIAYWLYAPGEQAVYWDEYYQDGLMGLGWNKIGDLKEYRKQQDLVAPLKQHYGADTSQKNNADMLYGFANEMKPGDIVFAKKGRSMIVGRGVVTSEYYYDGNRENQPHLRKVNWTHKGEWKSDSLLAMKTLTNITRDTDLVKQLNKLIDGDSVRKEITIEPKNGINENYTKEKFLEEVFVTENDYIKLRNLLLRKKNLILQGAPGVGKTFAAKRLAYAIMGEKDDSRVMQVQFHQNYSYEDFVMGYKPNENGGFNLNYGIFHKFCRRASIDKERPYFFIIDEINRGNLSKIFGELLMLIENDYRDKPIQLSYNDETFAVPSNIYIIGMMNTADRSLAMIDYALRRRFSFFEMKPGFETDSFNNHILGWSSPKLRSLIKAIIELNEVISDDDSLGPGFCIGHSYLCNFDNGFDLDSIVEYDIIPMLREYWFDNDERFNQEAQKLRNALK
jgi:5-methylcytosine-specific restriction protein B